MTSTITSTPIPLSSKDAGQELLDNLDSQHTKPLWAQMSRLNPPLPNPRAIPYVWKYDQIRPHLLRAGELITEKQAERRVLMLVNPARGMCILWEVTQNYVWIDAFQKHHLQPTPCMLDFNWSCRMKQLQHIGTLHSQCVSLSKAMAALQPSTAAVSRWIGAMWSLLQLGTGMITGKTGQVPWSGLMGSICRILSTSPSTSLSITRNQGTPLRTSILRLLRLYFHGQEWRRLWMPKRGTGPWSHIWRLMEMRVCIFLIFMSRYINWPAFTSITYPWRSCRASRCLYPLSCG